MAGGGAGGAITRELDQTATWAVASVCAVIILISILLEKILHHVSELFTHKKKNHMVEALEKVKAELMILGFISLLLTFGQSYIVKICIPEKAADAMMPCPLKREIAEQEEAESRMGEGGGGGESSESEHRRLLLSAFRSTGVITRSLMGASSGPGCHVGKVPLISLEALHQLHIFIFFLAVFHVIYSAVTMALGRAKIRAWKDWETEAATEESQVSKDPSQFRFSHETSFVRIHASSLNKVPVTFYLNSFFRQFFSSVGKADYMALRHGFITVHLAPGSKFDFQKYIKRSLEDDFKVVVGISPTLWASAVLYLLLNVQGWHTLFWISVIPLLMILALGTKLQGIITEMALEITERHHVIQGIPLVQLSDNHFWFGRPHLVLFLIHLTLFQNAFQLIYFVWIWYEFGLRSCFNDSNNFVIARVCLGIGVQFLCSYITLPLYALVSQMGSQMKRSIFDEQTSKAIKKWHQAIKKKNDKPETEAPPSGSPKANQNVASQLPIQRHKSIRTLENSSSRQWQNIDSDTQNASAESPSSVKITMTATNSPGDLLGGSDGQEMNVIQNKKDDDFALINLDD